MRQSTAPFRADHVGSLLRPPVLLKAKSDLAAKAISLEQYLAIEDQEVERMIRMQENTGLQLVTDGELRRRWWHYDFLESIEGVEGYDGESGIAFKGLVTPPRKMRIVKRLKYVSHPMIAHFTFLKNHTRVMPKMTIPSPTVLHFRFGHSAVDKQVYPDIEEFFDDLGNVYRDTIADFYRAGCRYIQFDDTTWAFLCSEDQRQLTRDRGEDPDVLEDLYARAIKIALKNRPHDMIVTTHLCRGNFKSTWVSMGGYEPIAERVFGELDYDGFFLEYDSERAGGFEPLRFIPRGKTRAVLGLITSKTGELESKDMLKRRIDEAAKYIPLDQICISPQCGFASTLEGNMVTEDDQRRKLALVVETANDLWGNN